MALYWLVRFTIVSQIEVFLLYIMIRNTRCIEGYWKEMTSLEDYLPYSDLQPNTTSELYTCMMHCLMTEGCCFISYIAISSVCTRHYTMTGYTSQASTAVWTIVKDDECPCGWYRYDNFCFLFADGTLNWQDSVTLCQRLNARLVELDMPSKDEFIQQTALNRPGFGSFWTGGSYSAEKGTWVWNGSGLPITTYTNWYSGQPDNRYRGGEGAYCLLGADFFGFVWDDYNCQSPFFPVCEMKLT